MFYKDVYVKMELVDETCVYQRNVGNAVHHNNDEKQSYVASNVPYNSSDKVGGHCQGVVRKFA